MRYNGKNGESTTAEDFYLEGFKTALQIEDPHRSAVSGKRVIPHLHAWDAAAACCRVSLRVEGQYSDLAIFRAVSSAIAADLYAELQCINNSSHGLMPPPPVIRAARKAAGMTQAKAAEVVHAGLRTWNRWENGSQKMPLAEWELFLRKMHLDLKD